MRIEVFVKNVQPYYLWRKIKTIFYDAESLLTNIELKEKGDYITHQIYVEKKLTKINKLLFARLFLKLATECKFTISNSFF